MVRDSPECVPRTAQPTHPSLGTDAAALDLSMQSLSRGTAIARRRLARVQKGDAVMYPCSSPEAQRNSIQRNSSHCSGVRCTCNRPALDQTSRPSVQLTKPSLIFAGALFNVARHGQAPAAECLQPGQHCGAGLSSRCTWKRPSTSSGRIAVHLVWRGRSCVFSRFALLMHRSAAASGLTRYSWEGCSSILLSVSSTGLNKVINKIKWLYIMSRCPKCTGPSAITSRLNDAPAPALVLWPRSARWLCRTPPAARPHSVSGRTRCVCCLPSESTA
jgi:hypothetical protein